MLSAMTARPLPFSRRRPEPPIDADLPRVALYALISFLAIVCAGLLPALLR